MLKRRLLAPRLVARQESHGVGHVAMSERDLQARRGGNSGGDAGDDLNGDAGCTQRLELLAASAEDERIPAFEPHHGLPGARAFDEEYIDLLLRNTVRAFGFANGDQLSFTSGMIEHALADQAVVKNDIGRF